jgi:hypothetical protein
MIDNDKMIVSWPAFLFGLGCIFIVLGLALVTLAHRVQWLMLGSLRWSIVSFWPSQRRLAEASIRSIAYRWIIRTVGIGWILFGVFLLFSTFNE